jgi:hypothetical protein
MCIPIRSLMPDRQQEVAKLDRQLHSSRLAFWHWLSESLWGTEWRCLTAKCRESTIRRYPMGCLPYRRKRVIGIGQQNCFVHFIEAIIFGRWRGLFRIPAKTASLQNLVALESSARRHCPGVSQQARGRWPFSRSPWVAENGQDPSVPIWTIVTIWQRLLFFLVFSTFSFKDLLFQSLSLIVKVRLLERCLMLQSRNLADDSTVRCPWIHGTPYICKTWTISQDVPSKRSTALPLLSVASWASPQTYFCKIRDIVIWELEIRFF